MFHLRDGLLELHLSILQGVAERYRTPFFSALKEYSQRPTGVFHALPISQGKSIVNSHWIKDMVDFYGLEVFMAETSATCGGLDSLLEPTGPLREAQQLAAKAFGSRQTYFVTNGTSTANKIVTQSLVAPGDIVLLDRNCHQSHHYGMMLGGAQRRLPGGLSAERLLDVRRGAAARDQIEAAETAPAPASSTASR